ncbi:TPA: hypothetical protein ACH3X2_005214 [Trebouxia sp. C0005]
MFNTDSLHIGCAQSDGKTCEWPVVDDGVGHSVKCSVVSADNLKEHLDADDRLFMLHVNAVDGDAKADFGDKSISDEIERNVAGRWQSVFQDLPAELPPERSVFIFFEWVTGELSTLRQMMEVPNEPGLSPNNGLENALLSDQSMASNPRKGQAKRSGAKTTSHDGKAGHVMTHVCHCMRQED